MVMKKGTLVAIAGFLIVLALFAYSYYGNQATPPPEKNAALNTTAPKEKETIENSITKDENSQSTANNTASNSIPENKTSSTDSNEPVIEAPAPQNAAEAIEQAKKNGESMWLLFRSTTCAPCVEMQKVFDQLEPDYTGKVRFISIDVNDRNNIEILKRFRIQYIPTTFIIDAADELSYQNVGVIPTDDLKKELNKVVK